MSLSKEVIDQFVKAAKDNGPKKEPNIRYGTIVKSGGSNYVKLDGSDILTPFTTTVNTKIGERVIVNISNHSAIVMGNTSSPAARMEDAEEAGKTAANYLGFNDLGLIVGDLRNSELKKNVLIGADEIDIREGDKVLASFAETLIELGKNNPQAVISLCNGLGKILFNKDDSDHTNIMEILSEWISVRGNKYVDVSAVESDYQYAGFEATANTGSYNARIDVENKKKDKVISVSHDASDVNTASIRYKVRDGKKINNFTIFPDVATVSSPMEINGCRYGDDQTTLWSGVLYMSDSHTISLKAPVSLMANGIVLVFSRYVNGGAVDHTFSCHFIPKKEVATHPGGGHTFFLGNADLSVFGTKYLYISDTEIKGNSNNMNENTTSSSGIKLNSKAFVLRHVIGV